MLTEFRVSERSDLDTGEAEDGRSDTPLDEAMEWATAVITSSVETAGGTIFEPMERNEIKSWRWRSKAPEAPSDWRIRKERIIQQHAQQAHSTAPNSWTSGKPVGSPSSP